MEKKLCPFIHPFEGQLWHCCGEACQCWDEGVYDKYEAGCGMVPRENRRV